MLPHEQWLRLARGLAVNQRVDMTMHLPPLRSFTTKDQGHRSDQSSGACTGEQHRRGETEATEVMHDLVVTVL
ncbi:MAG: hypothetical protein K0R13_262 [Propionibacteriaceae bacterium]|nr:hypothetical protein [Propionibacteriaceae bacterium]